MTMVVVEDLRPGRRPTTYTAEIGLRICELYAQGYTLKQIGEEPGMPSVSTIMSWMTRQELTEFQVMYRNAQREKALLTAEEVNQIADDESGDLLDGKPNPVKVARDRLRIDSRKWVLGRLWPEKYSERFANVEEGKTLHITISREDAEL